MANPSDLKRNLGSLGYFITTRHSKEQKKGRQPSAPSLNSVYFRTIFKLLQHRIRRRLRNRSGYVEVDHTRVVDQESALTGATDACRDGRNRA